MRIAWYLGFGWPSIAVVVALGAAIVQVRGTYAWLLYLPFLAVALYMTARLRLFNTQPWRRIHAKAMLAYAPLAGQAYDEARAQGRDYDARQACRQLGLHLFGADQAAEVDRLLGEGRPAHFQRLVDTHPQVFVTGVAPERHAAVLEGIRTDIAASEPGPDVLIARQIEQQAGSLEAARYFHALLLGRVR